MSNTILSAKNSFQEGLLLDFCPEQTKATKLTNALNATLITYNGNELALQNDMGNARVETAFLPEGYIPVGTCEFGDIIYVVSYNPLKNLSQIGCFPSPERNISSLESDDADPPTLSCTDFQNGKMDNEEFIPDGTLKTTTVKKVLITSKLNPGDKYIIYNNLEKKGEDGKDHNNIFNNKKWLSNYNHSGRGRVALHVVSISDDGKIEYLDTTTKWYTLKDSEKPEKPEEYFISDKKISETALDQDLDEYRSLICSNWSIFNSKVSGKLAILAELETINSFSCQYIVDDVKDIETLSLDTNIRSRVYNINLYYQIDSDPEIAAKYLIVPSIKWKTKQEGNFQLDEKWIDCGDYYYYNIPIKSVSGDIKTEIPFGTFEIPLSETNTLNGDYVCEFDVIPAMCFGKLDYLKIPISIKFNLIYSGNSELTVWRYHNLGNTCTLQYGTEVYSKPGWETKYVKIEFYDNQGLVGEYLNKDSKSYIGIFTEYLNLGESSTNYRFSKISQNGQIIGHPGLEVKSTTEKPKNTETTEEFVWKETKLNPKINETEDITTYTKYTNDAGTLYPNFLYLAKITIEQSKITGTDQKTDIYYRWLWTNAMFNEYYTSELDFKILPFVLNLNIESAFEAKSNYAWQIEENNNLAVDTIADSKSYKVSKIGQDEVANVSMYVTPKLENSYDCFTLNTGNKNENFSKLMATINVGNVNISNNSTGYTFSQQESGLSPDVETFFKESKDSAAITLNTNTFKLNEYVYTADYKKPIDMLLKAELYTKFMINNISSSTVTLPVYSPIISNIGDMHKLGITSYEFTQDGNTYKHLVFNSGMTVTSVGNIVSSTLLQGDGLKFTGVIKDDQSNEYNSDGYNTILYKTEEYINNVWDNIKNNIIGDLFIVYLGGNGDHKLKFFNDLYITSDVSISTWVNTRAFYENKPTIDSGLFDYRGVAEIDKYGRVDEYKIRFNQLGISGENITTTDHPVIGVLGIKHEEGFTLLNVAYLTKPKKVNEKVSIFQTVTRKISDGVEAFIENIPYLIFLLFTRLYHSNKRDSNKEVNLKNYVKLAPYQTTISSNIEVAIEATDDDVNSLITLHHMNYDDYINMVIQSQNLEQQASADLKNQVKLHLTPGGTVNELSVIQNSLEVDFPDLTNMGYFRFGEKYILENVLPDDVFFINYQGSIIPYIDSPYYFTKDDIELISNNIFGNSSLSYYGKKDYVESIEGNNSFKIICSLLKDIKPQITQIENTSKQIVQSQVLEVLHNEITNQANKGEAIPERWEICKTYQIKWYKDLLPHWQNMRKYNILIDTKYWWNIIENPGTPSIPYVYVDLRDIIEASVETELVNGEKYKPIGQFNLEMLNQQLNKVVEASEQPFIKINPNLNLRDNFTYSSGLKLKSDGYFEYFGLAEPNKNCGITHLIKNAVLDTKYQIIP